MLKSFLEKMLDMGKESASPVEIGGRNNTAANLKPILEPIAEPLHTSGLRSIVDYIKHEIDSSDFQVIHIANESRVDVYSELNDDKRREHFLCCSYPEEPFRFGRFMPYSEFIIALQSKFVPDDNVTTLLSYVGNIREESAAEFKDDGVSQTVVCKTGIARLENVTLPNRIKLRPYRTFSEVEQPASEFVFRIGKNSDCALFEADGGAWKREAVKNIKNYLDFELSDDEFHIILE